MKKGFRSSALAAVVGFVLVGSGVALGQPDAGPSEGGASTSTSTSTSTSLGEFLRSHERVELPIPALRRFPRRFNRGFWAETVLIEEGRVLSPMAGADVVCKAPLRVDGNRASGSCVFSVDYMDGKGPHRMEFSISILATSTSAGRLTYDVETLCAGKTCLREPELCWEAGGDGEEHDCTLRPIYSAPTKATPARLQKFLAATREGRFDLIHECQRQKLVFVELYPDRSFYVRDPDNSMFPCGGTWHVEGLHIRGQCDNEKKDLEGSFDFLVNGVAAEGITFDAHLCVPGPADCGDESGGFWFPHGPRDNPGGMVVELIQGSKSSEMLRAVELRLRGTFWPQWQDAVGLGLPVLVRGGQARHPRVGTQIFYSAGEDAKRLSEVTARLLAPVVGPVDPRPWPGPSEYSVVVVVGEKVLAGGNGDE